MTARPPPAYHVVRALPKRALTRAAGAAASVRLPRALRAPVYGAYSRAVGARLDECEGPLEQFGTFNEFFTRRLRPGLRPWDDDALLSVPCDGRLDACGPIVGGTMVQAKGLTYRVADLLCEPAADRVFDGGTYATIYLSPADYHRVHAPADMDITSVVHEPGELWPVNGLSVPFVDGLFRRNERVVFHGTLPGGARLAVVMVGATVVGRIAVAHPSIATHRARDRAVAELDPAWHRSRGEELGAFLLGSTVIVVVEAAAGVGRLVPDQGDPVRLGAPLFAEARHTE